MFGNKTEKKNRILRIAELLRAKPCNQRTLAKRLKVHPSTVLDDVTHAQAHNVRLYEDARGTLHVCDPKEI